MPSLSLSFRFILPLFRNVLQMGRPCGGRPMNTAGLYLPCVALQLVTPAARHCCCTARPEGHSRSPRAVQRSQFPIPRRNNKPTAFSALPITAMGIAGDFRVRLRTAHTVFIKTLKNHQIGKVFKIKISRDYTLFPESECSSYGEPSIRAKKL